MAQVRKYATGGGTEKKEKTPPTLFHWDGIGDYNVEDLEKTYASEIDNVLSQYDLDEEDKRKIRDRAYLTLQEIKSGRMGNRNANGTWVNVTPGFESTGMNEKERKWFLGKKRYVKDADFYQNLAYDVLDQMIGKTNTYTAPKDQVVTPDNVSDFNFGNYLTNYYFYNKQFDPNNWDFANAKANIGSRLAEFKKKVIDSNLSESDKNDLLGRISQVEAAFQTEDINDDYYGLVRLMNDPRRWFDKNYAPVDPNQKPLTEEERKAQEDKQRFDEAYKARLASDKENWTNNYISWTYDPNLMVPNYSYLSPVELQSKIQWDQLNKDNYTNTDLMGLFHSYISSPAIRKGLEESGYFENGWYYLPDTQDVKNNIITRVNPTTYTFERVPFTSFKTGNDYYTNQIKLEIAKELGIANPWDIQVPQGYKEGGILKAQKGLSTDYIRKAQQYYKSSTSNERKTSEQKEKEAKQETGFNDSNKPIELNKETALRAASLVTDLTSLIASMSGVGSLASAGTGAVATGLNHAADMAAGMNFFEALTNNAVGYGLDALSVIPFAKTAKIGKMLSTAAKLAPLVITVYSTASNADEIAKTWTKVANGENLTMRDYRTMLDTLSTLVSGKLASQNVKKLDRNIKASINPNSQRLHTNQGKVEVDNETISRLKNAKSFEEANSILQNDPRYKGLSLNEKMKWFRKIGLASIKTSPVYKAPKEYNTYSGELEINNKIDDWDRWFIEKGKLPLFNWNIQGKVRNAYNKVAHPQASKRAKNNKNKQKQQDKNINSIVNDLSYIFGTAKTYKAPTLALPTYNKSYKHQQGGIIKGQGGFRIGAKSKWTLDDRNKALANYNFAGDVQSYLNSGSDIDSYIAAFNGGEDLYDRMVGDTNYFTNMSGNYRKEDPLAYQRQMTFRNTNKGFDDLIRGSIIGYGTTEGASNFDKYLGDRTYNRTLGYLTPEQAAAYNKQINQFGIELFQSPNNKNHYRLRKIPGWINPNKPIGTAEDIMGNVEMPTLPTAEQVLTKSGGTGRNAGLDQESKNTNSNSGNASAVISDLLGLGRLAGTIWTNNRIAKTLKNSLSPLLIDPPQIRRQVMGDLATRTYMENLGAEANRIGSRPITSDASLQLGQALDYNNRANEYRIKGYLADKQAIDKTSLAAQEAAEQNAIARVDAANRNRASMLGIRQAKANIEAQRKSANWSQAVAPWLMDKEYRLRQNNQLLKELDYQEQDYLNRKTLNDAVSDAQDAFNRAKNAYIAAGNDESTWVGSPAYEQALNQLNQAKQKAADIYNQARIKAKKSIYSSPWIMFKSGGKLSYEEKAALEHDKAVNKALLNDSKEFNKIIRESKKENNKLILSLSGLTKELVIKSMTYGG